MNYDHFNYCEELAKSLKAIGHTKAKKRFFRASEQTTLQELEENMSSVNGTIIIAIDGQLIDYGWPMSDSLLERSTFGVVIAKPSKSHDTATIFEAQKECKKIARECVSKIMNDAYSYKNDCDKVDKGSFQIEGIGPIADLYYGVLLTYSLDYGVNFELNPEMWL